jgi:hypothetical protein
MNHPPLPPDDSWESDAVWLLLDQAPPAAPSPRFVEDTLRSVRLMDEVKPWWKRLLAPLPLAAMTTATAALALVISLTFKMGSDIVTPQVAALDSPQAIAIQDIAETETLLAAVDQLEDFSDHDLVCLIGF